MVFDLDATLVAGDTMAAYLRSHLPRRPAALVLSLAAAPLWAPALLTAGTRRAGQRLLIALATHGRSTAELQASAAAFAHDFVHTRGRAHPLGVAVAQSHLAAGHRVVVATECWDVLARALCAAMALTPTTGQVLGRGVQVVAEDLAADRGGLGHLKVLAHYKDGKVRALIRAGITMPVAAAYSDSVADLPLLTRAKAAHVVNPGRWQQRRFHRALGAHVAHLWSPGTLAPQD